jgi:hypothetical protein
MVAGSRAASRKVAMPGFLVFSVPPLGPLESFRVLSVL